ncbi:MAG TPA: translocation/assembly module TamB domain-containing protein [Lacunisphaera sp.]|jgi:translocation and assembly module TamB
MSRGWKIILWLALAAAMALAALPWWLGLALRPILHAERITFDRYERVGYGSFKLHQAQYTHPSVVITASEIQANTPLVWFAKWVHGGEPLITVTHWSLRHTPTPSVPGEKRTLNGMADLQRLLIRLVPILHRWLPLVHLDNGELRGITPEITLAHGVWHDSILKVDGVGIVGWNLDVGIAAKPDHSFNVTARSIAKDANVELAWSAPAVIGKGAWWDQPVQLNAHYTEEGWLPATADVVADNWNVAASRLKLGAPYERVSGQVRLRWSQEAYDVSLNAKAVPATGAKAPAFETQASAHGNFHDVTLNALHIDAPFAIAKLSAPVTFSVAHPLTASAAELAVKVDLAKLPWVEAHGTAEGRVTVSPDEAGSRQTFELDFSGVSAENYSLEKGRVRGVLAWPNLTLETFEAQLDKGSSISAHGSINWQTRELSDVTLQAKLAGPAFLAHWLPPGAGWTTAEIAASAQGPLDAPRHHGTLKLTDAILKPLQPMAIDASWQGTGTNLEIESARVKAGESTLDLAGTLAPGSVQLTKLIFSPHGEGALQLSAPAQLSWSPVWNISGLQLKAPVRKNPAEGQSPAEIQITAKGGPDGTMALNAIEFDSAWLQDWFAVTGPHWLVHTLQAHGRDAHGVLEFDTTMTGQIAMEPRPAEFRLNATGNANGIQLKELTVVESKRELTRATGKLPIAWKLQPEMKLSLDENAPLELSAVTESDSPLWSALSAYTGLKLAKPEAKIELKGSLRAPVGDIQLQVARFGLSGKKFKFPLPEFENLTLAMQLNRETVTLTRLSTQIDGQALQASGKMPMDDAHWKQLLHHPMAFDWSTATAHVEIPDADLAVLSKHLPNLIAPKGRLHARVDLAAGGTFSGELHLIDATARPLPPFSTLQEINADLTLSDRTLTVRKLTAKLGSEPVIVDGSVTLVPGEAPRLALGLKGTNLPLVRNTSLLIRNDVDLHAITDAKGITRVSGTITLRDCLVLANLSALLPTGQRGVTRQPPYFSVDADPFRTWPLAVDVRGSQAIRIRTAVFNGTASARFQLGGTLGEPRAVGELTVNEGQVLFPFATFAVQSGTLRLRESDPFHATVNVIANSQRHDYQLRLEATGQLPTPNLVLSSTPALDAEDVLLMVMTGQPPTNDATTTSSAGQRLAVLGAYLGKGIFDDLGYGGENRLEISTGEQVSLQGRETYEFEYKLDKRWSLTGEYDRFDSYNAGLKWRVYTEESKPVEKK